ncbi:alpha/beta hydrolase [Rhodococcus sp. NPDC058514]|uniref:alpha/beta hydrolase n=1 Tax=unclassified Rhodococcus (in: high G+C Gram-positive bacteria) TaxID=192944 RepID=UPI00365C3B81
MTIDTLAAADLISPTPLLVVHGVTDEFCSPEGAQAVYDRAGEPKKLVWLPTSNHIDLYDVPEFVQPAFGELTAFFDEHL